MGKEREQKLLWELSEEPDLTGQRCLAVSSGFAVDLAWLRQTVGSLGYL